MRCIDNVWVEAGCVEDGEGRPGQLLSTQQAPYLRLNLRCGLTDLEAPP